MFRTWDWDTFIVAITIVTVIGICAFLIIDLTGPASVHELCRRASKLVYPADRPGELAKCIVAASGK